MSFGNSRTKITFAQKFSQSLGKPSGFDYIRISLAICIVVLHCWEVSYGRRPLEEIYGSFWRAPGAAIVPMFFSVSGFLVAASLERSKSVLKYLALRALRIVPPLAMQVFIAALVVGPIFTIYPLNQYFADEKFHAYLWTMVGNVHFQLPGVFSSNPVPDVTNAQLWTLPYEIICYVLLALVSVTRIYNDRMRLLIFAALYFALTLYKMDFTAHSRPWDVADATLPMVFIAGMVLYKCRETVPWNKGVFVLAAITSYVLLACHNWDFLVPIPIAYTTIYLGLINFPRNKIILGGDYSYSIYLYGFLVQQVVAALGPPFWHWYMSLCIALPVTILLAVVSWWTIEKPTFHLRELLKAPRRIKA